VYIPFRCEKVLSNSPFSLSLFAAESVRPSGPSCPLSRGHSLMRQRHCPLDRCPSKLLRTPSPLISARWSWLIDATLIIGFSRFLGSAFCLPSATCPPLFPKHSSLVHAARAPSGSALSLKEGQSRSSTGLIFQPSFEQRDLRPRPHQPL